MLDVARVGIEALSIMYLFRQQMIKILFFIVKASANTAEYIDQCSPYGAQHSQTDGICSSKESAKKVESQRGGAPLMSCVTIPNKLWLQEPEQRRKRTV